VRSPAKSHAHPSYGQPGKPTGLIYFYVWPLTASPWPCGFVVMLRSFTLAPFKSSGNSDFPDVLNVAHQPLHHEER
jgi:hypothetical protein